MPNVTDSILVIKLESFLWTSCKVRLDETEWRNLILFFSSLVNVIFALTSISFQTTNGKYDYVGQGVWCGLFCLTAGILGSASSFHPSKHLLVSAVTFSSISIFFSFLCLVLTAAVSGYNLNGLIVSSVFSVASSIGLTFYIRFLLSCNHSVIINNSGHSEPLLKRSTTNYQSADAAIASDVSIEIASNNPPVTEKQ